MVHWYSGKIVNSFNRFKTEIYRYVYFNIFIPIGLAGMSFGFFLSTVCSSSADALKLSIGVCLPHMLFTGIIWPLEGMPNSWMRSLAWFFPHTAVGTFLDS